MKGKTKVMITEAELNLKVLDITLKLLYKPRDFVMFPRHNKVRMIFIPRSVYEMYAPCLLFLQDGWRQRIGFIKSSDIPETLRQTQADTKSLSLAVFMNIKLEPKKAVRYR